MSQIEGPLMVEHHELKKAKENLAFNLFLKHELFPLPKNLVESEAELIGQVLLKNESKKSQNLDKLKEKSVQHLSRQELMILSEKIEINGSNLWQIYMNKLIGENGLRRIIHEHIHSGNVIEILKQEIMEHDIDYERDPAIRDLAMTSRSSTNSYDDDSSSALDNFLKKAEASFNSSTDDQVKINRDPEYKPNLEDYNLPVRQNILDKIFISIIIALLITIFLIYITRH